jgi:predicted ATPase
VLTGFEGFEFNTVQTDRIGFSVKFADSRGAVPAANLSHGTLSLIGMMVLLLSPDRPPLLCLEEPENGLTPRATRAVYEAIRDLALNEDPSARSQILLSSLSPFVICAAWNGDERDFTTRSKWKMGVLSFGRSGKLWSTTAYRFARKRVRDVAWGSKSPIR